MLAVALTLPGSAVLFPLAYAIAAIAWNATGADAGGPAWPVTLTYAVLIGLGAAANVAALRVARRRYARRPPPAVSI